jgi:hypothetical protein
MRNSLDIDRLLFSKERQGILRRIINAGGTAPFRDLQRETHDSAAALCHHVGVLMKFGFITKHKALVGNYTKTDFTITPEGRRQFAAHIAAIVELAA